MKKQAPYEHEHVEGFHKLENLEVHANMESILQPTQMKQVEATLIKVKHIKLLRKLYSKSPR
jgi:hypothetical protein